MATKTTWTFEIEIAKKVPENYWLMKLPAGSTSLDLTGSQSDDKVSNEAVLSLTRPDKASICISFCFPSSGICICKRYLCETMVPQPCSLAMLWALIDSVTVPIWFTWGRREEVKDRKLISKGSKTGSSKHKPSGGVRCMPSSR